MEQQTGQTEINAAAKEMGEQLMVENKRTRKKIILVTLLVLLVITGMFAFAYLKQQQMSTPSEETATSTDMWFDQITRIDAKHFYIDGVHTIAGSILTPTPCDILQPADVVVHKEFDPVEVTLDFKTKNEAEVCVEEVTTQRFIAIVKVPENAVFKALFHNHEVELNLMDPEPGETPEQYEMFFKG